jgi:ribosomal-protein-alanine N-acetyltransferase
MLTVNFNPFPNLQTQRLLLKQISKVDVENIFEIRSDKDTMHFIPRPIAKTLDDAIYIVNRITDGINKDESINWGIYLKDTAKLIGIVGFVRMNKDSYRAEIGYILNKNYHKKGIMTEAVKALIDFGFNTMQLNSIEAIIHPENKASIGLVESRKFVKEAYLRDYLFYNNKFEDAVIFSLLKREA